MRSCRERRASCMPSCLARGAPAAAAAAAATSSTATMPARREPAAMAACPARGGAWRAARRCAARTRQRGHAPHVSPGWEPARGGSSPSPRARPRPARAPRRRPPPAAGLLDRTRGYRSAAIRARSALSPVERGGGGGVGEGDGGWARQAERRFYRGSSALLYTAVAPTRCCSARHSGAASRRVPAARRPSPPLRGRGARRRAARRRIRTGLPAATARATAPRRRPQNWLASPSPSSPLPARLSPSPPPPPPPLMPGTR
jgi:hypothetical protein